MTKLRWLLLASLAVVSAGALRLSGRPIMETARSLGVPDDGSLATAVLMIEGAQLILTALWLHPGTSRQVRAMAAFGTIGCLLLSAGAGWSQYGPVGVVPALVYAGLVHILSRDLLAGAEKPAAGQGYVGAPRAVAMNELPRDEAVSWGGPDAVTAPPAPEPAEDASSPGPVVTLRSLPARRRGGGDEPVSGWQEHMAAVPRVEGMTSKAWLRARARALPNVTQAGKKDSDLRRDVERAELEQARRTAEADDEDREAVPA